MKDPLYETCELFYSTEEVGRGGGVRWPETVHTMISITKSKTRDTFYIEVVRDEDEDVFIELNLKDLETIRDNLDFYIKCHKQEPQ